RIRLRRMHGGFDLLLGLTLATGTAAALLIGIHHVRSGILTLGDLLVVMFYVNQLPRPLETMRRKLASLGPHVAGAKRVFAMLGEPVVAGARPHARPLGSARGEIAFHDVGFVRGEDRPMLQDVSFEI